MYQFLSHHVEENMPAWPENPQLKITKKLEIQKGDVANTALFTFYNHTGTHMDAPNHYLADGVTISELPAAYFVFERPYILHVPKEACEKITAADVAAHAEELQRCDILLFHTGFSEKYRGEVALYEQQGPGIGSDCAAWLVENCPELRAVTVDFVSMASVSDQEDGNKTHRILFRGKDGHFICGIEDVDMRATLNKKLTKVIALPWMIRGIDSAPVTVIGEIE